MRQTTMKILALVCLAIAVMEVAPDPCGGRTQPNVVYMPYPAAQPMNQPANQQTNTAPPAAAASGAMTTGRRKRNAENDNPPPAPRDHSKEQGKKDQLPPIPHGGKVSIKSKSVHDTVSGQANSASHSASFAHKGVQVDNKKANSNSMKLGMRGLPTLETKSESNKQSSLNVHSMQGEQKGTHGHTSFKGKKISQIDSLKLTLGGGKHKLDDHSGTALGGLSKSSVQAGQGAHGLAGGFDMAKHAVEAGQATHVLAGGSDSVKNAAGGKSEVHGKQGLEVHNGLHGNHEVKSGSAHVLSAGTKSAHGAQVQGASDNLHKIHGSSAGLGENKAGVVATGHSLGKTAQEAGGNMAVELAKKGAGGAAGAASSVASHGVELGKKQIDVAASAAKKGANGAMVAGTAAGIHATHGLKDAGSHLAESANNVAGAVTGDVHTHQVHKAAIEAVHHGKKELENGASGKAKVDIKLKTK